MTNAEQLNDIYERLRGEGRCTTKKEYAELLGVNYSTLINAMQGSPKYANDKIVARAKSILNGQAPAPAPAPVRKEIVIPQETMELYTNLSRTAAQLAETLDRLLSGETKKGAV